MTNIINQRSNNFVNKLETNRDKSSIEVLPTDILYKILYQNVINIAKVQPDEGHQRIFKKFKNCCKLSTDRER